MPNVAKYVNSQEAGNIFFHEQQSVVAKVYILSCSRSHSGTPHSVGFLWTSDRPVARDLCLTTHNTHKRETSMHQVRFEPAIPASERPQTRCLDGSATETGRQIRYQYKLEQGNSYFAEDTRYYTYIRDQGIDWIHLPQGRCHMWFSVKTVMQLRIP